MRQPIPEPGTVRLTAMPSDTYGDLRQRLLDEEAELRRKLEEIGFGVEGTLSYDQNFADTSQVTAERGEAGALAASLGEALVEVRHALAKFDADTYGKCEDCGEEISRPRLEAMPEARYCINCAAARR